MNTEERHVVPLNDLREHVCDGLECWCEPKRSADEPLVIVHNSMDGRELYESGKRRLN